MSSTNTKKPKAPPRTGRAGKARSKIDDLPDLIPHRLVADKLGVTPDTFKDWVDNGTFPMPHSKFEQTLLYRVDFIRAFLDTGIWPDGARFQRGRGGREG
jgi:hypothetical protein